MFKNRWRYAVLIFLVGTISRAQVVSPNEINDPELRSLQVQFHYDLSKVGSEIVATKFDYPFYLSRKLDLDEDQQQRSDQTSIRFDRYGEQVVLAISGNYYAAYSGDRVSGDRRALQSFVKVIVPILQAAVPRFQSNQMVQGYAVEISHHVIGTSMGVNLEHSENLMVFLPQRDALKLVGSKDKGVQQSALLGGKAFLNGEPIDIWLNGDLPSGGTYPKTNGSYQNHRESGDQIKTGQGQTLAVAANAPEASSSPSPPVREISPGSLSALQTSKQEIVGRLIREVGPQAHFATSAAPTFVAFRTSIYLELSLNSTLPENTSGSRYTIAAVAFDDHIAHLLRPATAYFKDDKDFDGIGFSTTVRVPSKAKSGGTSEAVEFFFPFSLLRCYAKYDCTGQQLIDAGTVLIDGERVALDLQNAESNIR